MKTFAQYLHAELHGVLDFHRLEAAVRHAQKRLEEDRAQAAISEIQVSTAEAVARQAAHRPPPVFVVAQVAAWFSMLNRHPVTPEQLVGRDRHQHLVEPRQVAMFAVKQLCGLSSVEVGKLFGRDHTTVLYALKQVQHHDHEDLLSYLRAQLVNMTGEDAL